MRRRNLLVGTLVLAAAMTAAMLVPRATRADKTMPADQEPQPGPLGCAVCFVAEMAALPDAYKWQGVDGAKAADLAAGFPKEWAKTHAVVRQCCTPQMATAMSRWARPQMRKYKGPPALKDVKFTPVLIDKDRNVALLEAIVEQLPSHHQVVVRWLKLYAYYDVGSKTILQVTVTIRGQVEE